MSKRIPGLIPKVRACECCERTATIGLHNHIPGEPWIVAINMLITFKGAGKQKQKLATAVRVCTDCLALALADPTMWERAGSRRLARAIRERLSRVYSSLLEADAPETVRGPTFPGNAQGSLLGGRE